MTEKWKINICAQYANNEEAIVIKGKTVQKRDKMYGSAKMYGFFTTSVFELSIIYNGIISELN